MPDKKPAAAIDALLDEQRVYAPPNDFRDKPGMRDQLP